MNIKAFILEENLIVPGDRISVALSGGPDSMALLHWLLSVRREWQLSLSAVHIHHGLREASNHEEVFVRDWCEAHEVPLTVVRVNLKDADYSGMSEEEAARTARYGVFTEVAKEEGCLIALAHHMDDQAETVLLNLLRGAGPLGLRGMLPKRDIYIRPLLNTTQEAIMAYCKGLAIPYVTDESNASEDYTRNYLRHRIMPELSKHVQPKLVNRLYDTSRIMREEEVWMSAVTDQTQAALAERGVDSVSFDRERFKACPLALQRRMLRSSAEQLSGHIRNLTFDHIAVAIKMIAEADTGKVMDLPGDIRLRLDYSRAVLEKNRSKTDGTIAEEIVDLSCLDEGCWYVSQGFRLRKIRVDKVVDSPKNVCTKRFDYDRIGTDLSLRNRAPGDWLTIDKKGHRKKLKDYFVDAKVSRPERDRIPLLAKGSEILWVVGHRLSSDYSLQDATSWVLEVSYIKEEQ